MFSYTFLVGAHVGIVDLAFQISQYKRKSDGVCLTNLKRPRGKLLLAA